MNRVRAAAAAAEAAGLAPALAANDSFTTFPCPSCRTGRAMIDAHTAICTNGCASGSITGPLNLAAHTPNGSAPLDHVRVVTMAEFAAVDEPGADPLVGEGAAVLIAEGSVVMEYGDGGAGKTTLAIDLACHLAAGNDWLGMTVRAPSRVLLVENEGPRALFRAKLRRKLAGWTGPQLGDRVSVWETPWTKLRFDDYAGREELARIIREREIDFVTVGPITATGMTAAGTIQEVREFAGLVERVRELSGRPGVTFNLIHHENAAGKVSGAWEGVVDTLLHVSPEGNGKTRVHVQKARWSSLHHNTVMHLTWADGDGYAVDRTPEFDDAQIADLIIEAIRGAPGIGWSLVEKAVKGVNAARRRGVRDGLLGDGRIVNVAKVDGEERALDRVEAKKTSSLFLADDPTIRHLRPDPDADGTQMASAWAVGISASRKASASSVPAVRRDADVGTQIPPPSGGHERPSMYGPGAPS